MALMGREAEAFMKGFLKTRLGQFKTKAEQEELEKQRQYEADVLAEERQYAKDLLTEKREYEKELVLDAREWEKTMFNLEQFADLNKMIMQNTVEQQRLDSEELEKKDERRNLLEKAYGVPPAAADSIMDMGWGNSDSLLDYFLNDPNVGVVSRFGTNWADPSTLDGAGFPIINYFMPTMDKSQGFSKNTAIDSTKNNIPSAGNSTINVLTRDTTAGSEAARAGEIKQVERVTPTLISPVSLPEVEEVKEPVAADYNQLIKSVGAVVGSEFDSQGNLKIMDSSKQVEFNAAMFEANAYISGGITKDTNQAALQASYITSSINAQALNMQNMFDMAEEANAVLRNEQGETIELNKPNFIEAKFNELRDETTNPFLLQYYLQQIGSSPFGRSRDAKTKINSLLSEVLALQLGTNK
jgi:hypothetical protein